MVGKDSNEANISQGKSFNFISYHMSNNLFTYFSVITAVTPNDLKGKIVTKDGVIVFDKVPIVTPNSDLLVISFFFMTFTLYLLYLSVIYLCAT